MHIAGTHTCEIFCTHCVCVCVCAVVCNYFWAEKIYYNWPELDRSFQRVVYGGKHDEIERMHSEVFLKRKKSELKLLFAENQANDTKFLSDTESLSLKQRGLFYFKNELKKL